MKVKLIYNPVAGSANFKNHLDYVIERFQDKGYQIVPFRTKTSEDAYNAALRINPNEYVKLVLVGGDGTICQAINGLMKNNIDIPVGIIPAGTSNDLAFHLGVPKNIRVACDIVLNNNYSLIDIGKVNERYFVNICSAGLLTEVSHKTEYSLKNNLGKLAYYLKGLEKLPHFKPFTIDLKSKEKQYQGPVYLFLIMNGKSAGGFTNVAPQAQMEDGLLEVILFKPCPLPELVTLFIKVIQGEHLSSPNLIYFQTSELTIDSETQIDTDLDGEKGPEFPIKITCLHKKIKMHRV